jgi:hypothetical protein
LFDYATTFIENILKLKDKTIGDISKFESRYSKDKDKSINDKLLIKVTDTVSDICRGDYLIDRHNTLVFDKNGQKTVGWITVLDIANAEENTEIGDIIRPLPQIDKKASLLRCFSKEFNFQNPFYRIMDKNGDTGSVLDRLDAFRLIFKGYSSF